MLPDENPYAPPETRSIPESINRPIGSKLVSFLAGIHTLAFVTFSIVLLQSNSLDQKAGWMFLCNVPVMLGLVIGSYRNRRIGAYCATAAAGLQMFFAFELLRSGGGVWPVIMISAAIVIPLLTFALALWTTQTRSPKSS